TRESGRDRCNAVCDGTGGDRDRVTDRHDDTPNCANGATEGAPDDDDAELDRVTEGSGDGDDRSSERAHGGAEGAVERSPHEASCASNRARDGGTHAPQAHDDRDGDRAEGYGGRRNAGGYDNDGAGHDGIHEDRNCAEPDRKDRDDRDHTAAWA